MDRQETQERLRRAASLLAQAGPPAGDATQLLQAWNSLKGLRGDDFPAEIRPAFSFIEHEIARADSQHLSAREIAFLTERLQKLDMDLYNLSGEI